MQYILNDFLFRYIAAVECPINGSMKVQTQFEFTRYLVSFLVRICGKGEETLEPT